jgi:UDP-hydrolysing UDP-N-acetyl-D-glucosamine 2-epimerase
MTRRICVVTGSRADYGLVFWLLKELADDDRVELSLVVTGSHLSPEFGSTIVEIRRDGFPIGAEVEMLVSSDTAVGITKSVGLGVVGFADTLHRLRPDLMVVLGDRYEIFAAAQAAMFAGIPLAHIHGGEVSEGAIDEQIRHAITKMAQLHFVSAEPHLRRVIQLGESPEHVFLVGAPGLDGIARLPLLDRTATEAALGLALRKPSFLVTYHPATLGSRPATDAMTQLLAALDDFPTSSVILTMPNADAGGRGVAALARSYAGDRPDRVGSFASLGQIRYLSALKHVDVVIGNSSSGLIEAPPSGTPTVNIGPRQYGRLRADTVIDCEEDRAAISAGIARALSPEMQVIAARAPSPYGQPGDISRAIKEILVSISLEGIARKRFHDLDIVLP